MGRRLGYDGVLEIEVEKSSPGRISMVSESLFIFFVSNLWRDGLDSCLELEALAKASLEVLRGPEAP